MKAILEFDLDDPDDRQAHHRATMALHMACAIQELLENVRRIGKHESLPAEQEVKELRSAVQEMVNDLEEHGASINSIIS